MAVCVYGNSSGITCAVHDIAGIAKLCPASCVDYPRAVCVWAAITNNIASVVVALPAV